MGKNSYTFEECKLEASKFKDKTSFKVQSGNIYNYAYKRGWLNEICSHMKVKKKENGFWTKYNCLKEAKKYNTKTEFSENSPSGYSVAKRNGWLKECQQHMTLVGNKFKRAIYVFEFFDSHAYIGLTYNIERRKNQHLNQINSPVYKHLQNSSTFYNFRQLSDYLELEQAVEEEEHYLKKYEKENWILLNSRNAGATGGLTLIWTYQRCFEEALEYQTRRDFENLSPSAYNSARRNGWLDDICSHMERLQKPKNFWNEQRCTQEALKYQTRTDFKINSGSAYLAAYRMGILDKICNHMTKKKSQVFWTKKNCHKEAVKYNTKSEFKKACPAAYSAAIKAGILNEICDHMINIRRPNGFWSFENCKKKAKRFKSRSEFQRNNVSAYREALKNGWLDEICSHMNFKIKPKNYWTKERCHKAALRYKTRAEFQEKSNTAYRKASKEKWLDEICSHMKDLKKPKNYWTKERCRKEAMKYSKKNDFRKKAPNVYSQAHRKGFLEEICSHMSVDRRPTNFWTKDRIIEEAKKYKSRTEFNKNSGGAAIVARGYGWYEEIWLKTHPNDYYK